MESAVQRRKRPNGLPDTDWRDAQYDMLYLPVTETVRYHYDFNGNRTATVLPDGRQIKLPCITAAATCTKSASTTKFIADTNAISCTAKSTGHKVNSPAVTNSIL